MTNDYTFSDYLTERASSLEDALGISKERMLELGRTLKKACYNVLEREINDDTSDNVKSTDCLVELDRMGYYLYDAREVTLVVFLCSSISQGVIDVFSEALSVIHRIYDFEDSNLASK